MRSLNTVGFAWKFLYLWLTWFASTRPGYVPYLATVVASGVSVSALSHLVVGTFAAITHHWPSLRFGLWPLRSTSIHLVDSLIWLFELARGPLQLLDTSLSRL